MNSDSSEEESSEPDQMPLAQHQVVCFFHPHINGIGFYLEKIRCNAVPKLPILHFVPFYKLLCRIWHLSHLSVTRVICL